jgi:cytochrome c-type biogenesis protein CcmH/NrfF
MLGKSILHSGFWHWDFIRVSGFGILNLRKVMEDPKKSASDSLWSLPLLCLGLGIIAICILVPAAEANKRLTADRDKLNRDLTYVESQVSANESFLDDVGTNPEIAERLAQRQFRQIRQGTSVLELKGISKDKSVSPFEMVSVPPPPPVNEYHSLTGFLGDICGDTRKQIYSVGIGMFMVAVALVLGASPGTGTCSKKIEASTD